MKLVSKLGLLIHIKKMELLPNIYYITTNNYREDKADEIICNLSILNIDIREFSGLRSYIDRLEEDIFYDRYDSEEGEIDDFDPDDPEEFRCIEFPDADDNLSELYDE